jgi:hypothetical protein
VNVSGTALTSLSANISSTGNAIVAGETSVIVISAIAPALDTLVVSNGVVVPVTAPFGTTLSTGVGVNAATGAITAGNTTPFILAKEKFVTAFEGPGSGSSGALVQLTFSAIPAGVTITLPAVATSDQGYQFNRVTVTPTALGAIGTTEIAVPGTAVTLSSVSTTLSVYYRATTPGTNSATTIDTLIVQATIAAAGPYPITAGAITVTAQMAPPNPTGSTYIPRYAGTQCQIGPTTVVTISTGQTFMLMTYAVNTGGYDTGIAVANATSDPLATASSAAKQNGTITFTFYPQATAAQITAGTAPAAFSYTTSATSPGTGLTSAGVLNTGNTYTVLLSDLLTAAAQTTTGATKGTFQGYVIVTTNFTNGHGQYFVTNFTTGASQGTAMMDVLVPPRTAVPESLGN